MHTDTERRQFLSYFAALGLSSSRFPNVLWGKLQEHGTRRVTAEVLRDAAAVAGLTFSPRELEAMLDGVNENVTRYEALRALRIDNSLAPPLYFNPVLPGMRLDRSRQPFKASRPPALARPRNLEELAVWPVLHLAALLESSRVRSIELTEMYLDRLRRHNASLNCVVTLTEERATRQARDADREIAAGRYRGPLHGVPWGVKDIISTKGYPTTWGTDGGGEPARASRSPPSTLIASTSITTQPSGHSGSATSS